MLESALVLGSMVGLALAAPAQRPGEVWFEMLTHLEDFERHFLSEYSQLYDFTPYVRRSKHWISKSELEELRASWARERERVAAEIARLEADPVQKALHNARHRVNKNAFFRDVDKQWVDEHAPFHFVIQRPPKDRPGYYEGLAADYAPWAKALHRLFLAEYVEPLGLSMRPDYRVFLVALLGTEGAYDDYAKRNQAYNPAGTRAHYDPNLRLSVTYEPWAGGAQSADERRHAFMHELVHSFQHAYLPERDELPPHPWINEGLAEYLSSGTGAKPDALAQRALDAAAREMVAKVLKDPRARETYVLPLEELLDARSYYDIVLRVHQRARGSGARSDLALSLFYRQAYLLVYYLERVGGEALRAAFRDYLKAYFSGRGERASFEKALAAHDLGALESSWLEWIEPTSRGWRPARRTPAPAAAGTPSAEPAAPAYEPERLRPDLRSPERALAFALWQVLQGAPEVGRERLEDCARALEEGSEWKARIARELERLNAWIALRDRYLRWLAERQEKLTVEVSIKGKPVRRKLVVAGLEGGRVLFAANEHKLQSMPLAELDSLTLIREMSAARDFECGWERHYLNVLEGREHWEKKLPKDDPAAGSLRADAPSYAGLLLEGSVLARLGALAAAELPSGADAAESALEALASILADGRESAALREARPALDALAELCALESARARPLRDLLAGEVSELGEGRVLLRYGFADVRELQDFEPVPWPQEFPLDESAAGAGSWSVEGGRLIGRGLASVRHLAAFEGAQRVRYSLRWDQWGLPCNVVLVLGLDGGGGLVGTIDHGSVVVAGSSGAGPQMVQNSAPVMLGEEHAIEIRHDGASSVVVQAQRQSFGPLKTGELVRGDLHLLVNSVVPIALGGLEIEGRLVPDSLERIQRAHARRRVALLTRGP